VHERRPPAFDETYRDLTHGPTLPMAASLSPRAVSVSSMSKAYGLPGLRIGWAVCRDPQLSETLLAAKEQMFICGATIDEAIAGRVLSERDRILPPILDDARTRLGIVRDWMRSQAVFAWVEPSGGVVGIVPSDPMRTFIGRMCCTWGKFGLGWGILRHASQECHNKGAEFDTEHYVLPLKSLWKSLWKVCTRYNPTNWAENGTQRSMSKKSESHK